MKFAPYPFQVAAVDVIESVMKGDRQPTCIVAPTGAGKGVIEAAALARIPGLIVTTPSQPIATSIAVKLTGDEGLTGLSDGMQQRACEKLRIFTDMRAKNLAAAGKLSWATGLLRDECFVGSTDVSGRRIDNLRPGDTVLAPDGQGHDSFQTVVSVSCHTAPDRLYRVTADGRSTVATGNHPFFTPKGWVTCGELRVGDQLCRMPEGYPVDGSGRLRCRTAWSRVLLDRLHEDPYGEAEQRADGRDESEARVGSHEAEQPDGETFGGQEDARDTQTHRAQAGRPRGQRHADTRTSAETGGSARLDCRVPGPHRHGEGHRLPDVLQGRHRGPGEEGGGRDRWVQPQHAVTEGTGCEEEHAPVFTRVDGVEVLERGGDGEYERVCPEGLVYNLEVTGTHTYYASGFLVHNCHHGTNDTHESLGDLLPVPHAGCTATPYRGTPAGTKQLHGMYPGGIEFALRLEDAVKRGYVSLPEFRTLPLLDDETVDVKGGEFVVKSVESAVKSRVGQLAEVLGTQWDGGKYKRPLTVVLGSLGAVDIVGEAMTHAGLPWAAVTAATTNRERVFSRVVAGEVALLQIRAVGEGVDLPLRLMYDLSPTMSPVLWMQRVGRIMRSTDAPPTYYACCHNLMRHGYLFEGLIPRSAFTEARNVWGPDWEPSRRTMTRALGNTGFGRFLPAEVRLRDGGVAFLYALRTGDGLASYAALLLPHLPNPIYFGRADVLTGEMKKFRTPAGVEVSYPEKKQGRWRMLDSLPDLESCSSYPQDAVFPWMEQKWRDEAGKRGLDATVPPTRKTYQLFRILQDAGRAIA